MVAAPEILLCKGMRDLLPADMVAFRRIQKSFLDTSRAWGFAEVRTPTLEHLYLFTSTGTLSPHLLGRVYSFLDWDGWTGERVVLRPDATIPVARLYRERLTAGIAKLAYVANIFRFHAGDEPREVWQCGAELIGDSWPFGDLELMAMAVEVARQSGASEQVIRLSHTGVVRALLSHAGFEPDQQIELYDRLLDGDHNVLRDVETRRPELGPALALLSDVRSGGAGYLENLRSAFIQRVPAMAAPLNELSLMLRVAGSLGVAVEATVTGAHDFEYYTGPVFEVRSGSLLVASGGRYDRLIVDCEGGQQPACGFAMHVDSLMRLSTSSAAVLRDRVLVAPSGDEPETLVAALDAARRLQSAGVDAALIDGGTARWTLEVSSDPAGVLTLTDRQSGVVEHPTGLSLVSDRVSGGAA